ncbi:hypothetical protein [Spirillospora sp. CA-128828]
MFYDAISLACGELSPRGHLSAAAIRSAMGDFDITVEVHITVTPK